ncbi:uncharacterized protein LOC128554274 [Mercenaria mercenaria]|uniref:uncharacterized protein LOC128554274 n=1 Tax=Mercenaria mercenaria TaxID=6596 RepID=UPI00234F042F|nr:uncharacterized protein LOC128554274 [Mercenaria mercenaria]
MSHQEELENMKYRNWVRGVLAFKYFKEGIKGFADDVVEKEHRRINQDVISGRSCNQCSIRNLRPLHTCTKDHTGRNKCHWGQNNCNCLQTKKQRCPDKVCDVIMEEILTNHASTPPSPNWKNTDIQKWCSAPWEIAKCFINAPGYSDKSRADDIDISGLLHVFINNISYKTHLSDNINKGDIFQKILQRRNELFHSPTTEMEDTELKACIGDIIKILKNEKELKARQDAKSAVVKLKQLKQENFIITTHHEVDVCREALTSITNEAEELKQTIQNTKEKIAKKQAEAIEAVGDETKKILRDNLGESDNQNEKLYERVGRLERRLTKLEGRVDNLETIRQNRKKQLDCVKRKQALQNDLVKLYQQHYVKTSFSPLKSRENDISINEVYVSPQMAVEGQTMSNDGQDIKKEIHGYREIFQTNGQKHKAIYIVGDAGTGKSSFCKMMIQNWCAAFANNSVNIVPGSKRDSSTEPDTGATYEDINESDIRDSEWSSVSMPESEPDDDSLYIADQSSNTDDGNINEIRNFEFLFFVPLQKMSGLSDITEMIKAIVTDAGLASNDVIGGILERESERCLIVADGLDEWTLPKDKCRLSHVSYGLPKRGRAKHATVITLSRPSAKGILNMKSSECDKKVELLGINIISVKCFTEKYLSKSNNKGISSRAFMKKVKSVKLKHLEKTPLLLQQLAWLYCNEIEFGKSISDTYSHIINVMLGWTQNKKEEEDEEEDQIEDTNEDKNEKLPEMLRTFDRCEANKRYLLPLARVAFKAITSETGSNTFGREQLRKRGVSNNCITTLIKIGILVEENCFNPIKMDTRLVFIHISYLEFFAAIHVSTQYNKAHERSVHENTILEDLLRKSTADILQLSNVLKMICGLSPYIISELSKMISDIVSRDENMKTYRSALTKSKLLSPIQELKQIQHLMFNCLSEGDADDQTMFSLCDVIIDSVTQMSFLQRIIPEDVLSVEARYNLNKEVWRWIVQLKPFQYLFISNSNLPHSELVSLCSFIQETPLRCLTLNQVKCTEYDCEGHAINFSQNDQLQILRLEHCCHVMIPDINTKHLEILHLGSSSSLNIDLLLNASSLIELKFGSLWVPRFTYNNQMDSVVHTLHQLRKLKLKAVNIDTNALTVTPEMRNLGHIELFGIQMSLETWRTFVDSLLTLQQSVSVKDHDSNFEIDPYKINYVRENKMFEVLKDGCKNFEFRTKIEL